MTAPSSDDWPSGSLPAAFEAARNGSPEALGRLLEVCRPYLLLVANQELQADLQAKAGPSDLVQATFLKAHEEFARFHGSTEQELLAWLRTILLNNVANFRRHYQQTDKRQVAREVSLNHKAGFSPNSLAGALPSPSTDARARESVRELDQALEQLPEHYRLVLQLRHEENCSFEEIGRRTERSAEAARKLWVRAVEQLRQILGPSHEST